MLAEEDVADETAAAAAQLPRSPVTGSAKSVRFSKDIEDESAEILAQSRSKLENKRVAPASSRRSTSSDNTRVATGKPKRHNASLSPAKATTASPSSRSPWTEEGLALLKKMISEGEPWHDIQAVFHPVTSVGSNLKLSDSIRFSLRVRSKP
jgi:hypothetical protein